ncbi:hypothetical protein JCM11957_07050 [Caminibacter profundus]
MNKTYKYWIMHKCDFFKRLNKWLKENNKILDIYETNPFGAIFSAFSYWVSNLKEDIEPNEALEIWLEQNKDEKLYWSQGKEKDFDYWLPTLKELGYCKDNEENIVKKVCRELGITQKELAERMGVNDVTVRNWSSKNNPPEWAIKFMNLLLEFEKVKEKADKAAMIVSLLEELKK